MNVENAEKSNSERFANFIWHWGHWHLDSVSGRLGQCLDQADGHHRVDFPG